MHDHEGKIRAKVLGELMGHMISLHGKGSHSTTRPHADGTELGAPSGKVEGVPMMEHHMDKPEGSMGDLHASGNIKSPLGAKGMEDESGTDPDDLFGRKTGKKMAF